MASHGPPESWPTRCRPEWFAGLPVLVAGLGRSGRAAARQLADAAQSGDREAFLARWGELAAACSACHDSYRSPD